ncbi:MAG TPA: hypothetical protein VE131_03395, partial [Terriglobales bacterium]|nr:hypothetical protein [Terriglobales bacterium]
MRFAGGFLKFATFKFRCRGRRRLVRNYLLVFVSLMAGGMIASGFLDIYFRYYETQEQILQLQSGGARAAVTRIAQFILEIERQMKSATLGLGLAGRDDREDYFELA